MKRSDGLWRFACVNVLVFFAVLWDWCWKGSRAMSDCKQMGAMSVIGWQMGERVKGVVAVSTYLFTTLERQYVYNTSFWGVNKKSAAAGGLSTLAEVNNHPPKWTIICIAPPTHPPMCSAAICFHPILSFYFWAFREDQYCAEEKNIQIYLCICGACLWLCVPLQYIENVPRIQCIHFTLQ